MKSLLLRHLKNVFLCSIFISTAVAYSQEQHPTVNIQADIHSSLIWRGVALERNPVFQAALGFRYGQFQGTFLGAQTFGGGFNATLIQLQYSFESDWGTFQPMLTDYYFPGSRRPYFFIVNDGSGAHTLEAALLYQAPRLFPLRCFVAMNVFNDPRYSAYLEISSAFSVQKVQCIVFAGILLTSRTAWYSSPHSLISEQSGINALGIRATYTIPLPEHLTLPISTSFILNPNAQHAYVVASIGIR